MKKIVKKICMCGDSGVGKTSLVRRFVEGKYDDKYKSTLGAVVKKKTMKLRDNGYLLKMMIWDISGQYEFKRIHAAAFKNAKGGIAVCDLTRPKTAEALEEWINNLVDYAGENIPIVILANKWDKVDKDSKKVEKTYSELQDYGYPIITTSAKTGYNVEDSFEDLGNRFTEEDTTSSKPQRVRTSDMNVPNKIENSSYLLDYMMDVFCRFIGDYDLGMHIFRKQMEAEEIDFEDIDKMEVYSLIENLVYTMSNFKGEQAGLELQRNFMIACDHCDDW